MSDDAILVRRLWPTILRSFRDPLATDCFPARNVAAIEGGQTSDPRICSRLKRSPVTCVPGLAEGYERQRHFIASAAHELRTPIAILRTKVDAAPEPALRRLSGDVHPLGTLAEQLLDVQRLDTEGNAREVDLAALVRRVVGELAPLLIASGRTIAVQVDDAMRVQGDAAALERVVANLVQNAMEHGGRNVIVRVVGSTIEVEDDGPGNTGRGTRARLRTVPSSAATLDGKWARSQPGSAGREPPRRTGVHTR